MNRLRNHLLIIYMVIFSALMEVVGLFIVKDKWSYTMGLLFGLVFSILKLLLMKISIKKSLGMSGTKAQQYANVHYMIRYLLTGIVLVIGALEPSVSLLGIFIGLMSMKAGAYCFQFLQA